MTVYLEKRVKPLVRMASGKSAPVGEKEAETISSQILSGELNSPVTGFLANAVAKRLLGEQ